MTKHLFTFAFCLFVVTILREEPLPSYDPTIKDNVDATVAALIALGAEVPKFRGTFEAFKKNGLEGVQVFESVDQKLPRYEWLKGLSYVEAYKSDSERITVRCSDRENEDDADGAAWKWVRGVSDKWVLMDRQ